MSFFVLYFLSVHSLYRRIFHQIQVKQETRDPCLSLYSLCMGIVWPRPIHQVVDMFCGFAVTCLLRSTICMQHYLYCVNHKVLRVLIHLLFIVFSKDECIAHRVLCAHGITYLYIYCSVYFIQIEFVIWNQFIKLYVIERSWKRRRQRPECVLSEAFYPSTLIWK